MAVVALHLAGCSSWTQVEPQSLTLLNQVQERAHTRADLDAEPELYYPTVTLAAPGGGGVTVSGPTDVRIVVRGGVTREYSAPVRVRWDGDVLTIQGSDGSTDRIPVQDLRRVQVKQPSSPVLGIAIAGVAAAVLVLVVLALVPDKSECRTGQCG